MPNYRRAPVAGATYFFTLALADRRSGLLVSHIDALRLAYRRARELHAFHTIAICVLPDHLHAIWQLPHDDADFALRWRVIKSGFSRHFTADLRRSASKIRRREKGIWQRRYWEHQIRDAIDLQRHIDYIHYNPVKHGHAEQVRNWQFSSFHRYVTLGHYPEDWDGKGRGNGGFGE